MTLEYKTQMCWEHVEHTWKRKKKNKKKKTTRSTWSFIRNWPSILPHDEESISTLIKGKKIREKKKVQNQVSNWPRILPMVLHCGQAFLASNSFGNFKDFRRPITGTPLNSFLGVGLAPRRYLNWPTYVSKYRIISNQKLESANIWTMNKTRRGLKIISICNELKIIQCNWKIWDSWQLSIQHWGFHWFF